MNFDDFTERKTVAGRIPKQTRRVMVSLTNAIWLKALVIFISAGAALAAANMTPVAVSGFNRDLVIEKTAVGPSYGSHAVEFHPGEGTAFYRSGLSGKSYGLPAAGSFTSASGDGTVFQFQSYASSNALVLSRATGLTPGSLTLLARNTFGRIAVLANSASAASTSVATSNGVYQVTVPATKPTSFHRLKP